MSDINNIETIESNLVIHQDDWLKWKGDASLPSKNFIDELQDDDFDIQGYAHVKKLTWSDYLDVNRTNGPLAAIAGDLLGRGSFLITWSDGRVDQCQINGGKLTISPNSR